MQVCGCAIAVDIVLKGTLQALNGDPGLTWKSMLRGVANAPEQALADTIQDRYPTVDTSTRAVNMAEGKHSMDAWLSNESG
jgi:hypothetical protein